MLIEYLYYKLGYSNIECNELMDNFYEKLCEMSRYEIDNFKDMKVSYEDFSGFVSDINSGSVIGKYLKYSVQVDKRYIDLLEEKRYPKTILNNGNQGNWLDGIYEDYTNI
ncbi:hypothetical protein D3C73_1086620 [compost metagenome]